MKSSSQNQTESKIEVETLRRQLAEAQNALAATRRELAAAREQIETDAQSYGLITESIDDVISVVDYSGRIVFLSESFHRTLSEPEAELVGTYVWDCIHPADTNRVRAAYQRLSQGGEPEAMEWRFRHQDGSYEWMETTAHLLRDVDRPGSVLSRTRSIEARKRVEQELEDSRARFKMLTDTIVDIAYTYGVTPEGQLVLEWVSSHNKPISGYSPEELNARGGWYSLIYPPDAALVAAHRARMLAGQESRVEYRITKKSGELSWLTVFARPITDESGRTIRIYGAVQDITARREAEEEARRNAARYKTLLDNLPDVVFRYDRNLCRVYISPLILATTGLTESELLGCKVGENTKFAPDLLADLQTRMEHVIASQQMQEFELTVESESGPQTLHYRLVPEIENGEVQSVLSIARDVTERRRARAAQQEWERKTQETQRWESLGVMAGGIAHDFNNLLMGILGNVGLARMELAEGASPLESLDKIELASQRAADLTRQMLAYAGRGAFNLTQVNCSDLIESIAEALRGMVDTDISVVYDLARDLPPVEGDADLLHQIVTNLVVNASEAIGNAKGIITLRTGVMGNSDTWQASKSTLRYPGFGNYVFIEVADSGDGIEETMFPRIFEPFFSTKFAGRGLGLAAAMGIARQHRGGIEVASQPGQGATFRVLLPALHSA